MTKETIYRRFPCPTQGLCKRGQANNIIRWGHWMVGLCPEARTKSLWVKFIQYLGALQFWNKSVNHFQVSNMNVSNILHRENNLMASNYQLIIGTNNRSVTLRSSHMSKIMQPLWLRGSNLLLMRSLKPSGWTAGTHHSQQQQYTRY